MSAADRATAVQLGLKSAIEQGVMSALSRLALICEEDTAACPDLSSNFADAVQSISTVQIVPLAPSSGAFLISESTLSLSEEPISRLMTMVIADARTALNAGRPICSEDVVETLEKSVVNYTLHELRHLSQGVGLYGRFVEAKAIAGRDLMSDMDCLADRDAAAAYGHIYNRTNNRWGYLEAYREALFFSINYYFRLFAFASRRSDKLNRAFAVLLMAARLAPIDEFVKAHEPHDLPLDAPLIVRTSESSVAVFQANPTLRYLEAVKGDETEALIELICQGSFDAALDAAVVIAHQLKLVSV